MSKQVKADIGLLFVTLGWGSSFLLTKDVLGHMPTYNFLAIRFLIAFFISYIFFIKNMIKVDKKTIKYGAFLGIILFATYAFQTVGLKYTTPSKSAFITGFYVILVPLFSALMTKEKPDKKTIFSVLVAFVGIALLSLNKNVSGINIGDVYTFMCAIINALYIIYVGKYTGDLDSISFAVVQIGVVGLLSLITSFVIEQPIIPHTYNAWFDILILSFVCTSGAYIIQNVAQNYTTATHTALIYTAEPVFAGMFSYFIGGEILGGQAVLGAILILAAMLSSELDFSVIFKRSA